MCVTTFAALLGLAAGCAAAAPPSPLDPTDPRAQTRWHPPPSPMHGLQRYEPVAARADWGTEPTAKPAPMPDMKGMDMRGMDMKGMDMGGRR